MPFTQTCFCKKIEIKVDKNFGSNFYIFKEFFFFLKSSGLHPHYGYANALTFHPVFTDDVQCAETKYKFFQFLISSYTKFIEIWGDYVRKMTVTRKIKICNLISLLIQPILRLSCKLTKKFKNV